MKVVFLDFDGVLNSSEFFRTSYGGGPKPLAYGESQLDPRAIERLDKIIDATGAKIVISSMWRHVWSRGEIVRMLRSKGLRNYESIIGITPSLMKSRNVEVERWFELEKERLRIDADRKPVSSFVILDDTDEFTGTSVEEAFIRINPDVGLTDADVSNAISRLGT